MGTNFFIPLPPIPSGAQGLQPAIDLTAVAPPTGLDEHMTIICKGDFVDGYIAIMGSPDGVNYDVLTQFTSGGDADALPGPALEFSPRTINAIVRFVRADVRATVRGPLPTRITIGGEQNCRCTNCNPITATITPQEDGTFLIEFSEPVNGMQASCGGLDPPCCPITADLSLTGFTTIVAAPDGLSAVVTLHIFLTSEDPNILTISINENVLCPLVGKNGCPVTPLVAEFLVGGGGQDEA